jgi:hypothetical protein
MPNFVTVITSLLACSCYIRHMVNSIIRKEHFMCALRKLSALLFKSKRQGEAERQHTRNNRLFEIQLDRWFPSVL